MHRQWEVELLLEEMHRVLVFLRWDRYRRKNRACHVCQWVDSITHSPTPLPTQVKTAAFEEGLRVYTLCQASVRHCLFSMFAQQWHSTPAFVDWGLAEEEVAVDNRGLRRNLASKTCRCGILYRHHFDLRMSLYFSWVSITLKQPHCGCLNANCQVQHTSQGISSKLTRIK